jgi:5-methylcytosine-specific restriction enzyme A
MRFWAWVAYVKQERPPGWPEGAPLTTAIKHVYGKIRHQVRERDKGICQSCGGPGTTVDHIIPIAQGGSVFDMGNLQVLCDDCHHRKDNRPRGTRPPVRSAFRRNPVEADKRPREAS